MAEHTRLPWERSHMYVVSYGADGGNVAACGNPNASMDVGYTPVTLNHKSEDLAEAAANADFIVKATNLHHELLTICKDIAQGDSRKDQELWQNIVEAARSAIAKAEA